MANDRVAKALGERFTFKLSNTSGALVVVAILAAFFDTLVVSATVNSTTHVATVTKAYTDKTAINEAGYACDVVLDDGTIMSGVTAAAANSKMNIRQWKNYILHQPRTILDMTIQANNVAAFDKVIEVVKCSPLSGSASQYLPLSDFLSVDQQSSNKINITGINLETMFDTLMLLPIDNGHELTISMRFS